MTNHRVYVCHSDKDECNETTTPLCKEGTYCDNIPGSYKCLGNESCNDIKM